GQGAPEVLPTAPLLVETFGQRVVLSAHPTHGVPLVALVPNGNARRVVSGSERSEFGRGRRSRCGGIGDAGCARPRRHSCWTTSGQAGAPGERGFHGGGRGW